MNKYYKGKFSVLIITIVFISTCFLPLSSSTKVEKVNNQNTMLTEGQILYASMWGTNTYLLEHDGTLNHTWHSSFFPGVGVCWFGYGTIYRTIRVGIGPGQGGAGGGVQKVLSDGTVEWDFRYNTNGVLSHHDIKKLPNGNVLLIAWESKTKNEAIAAGRNPQYVSNLGLMPDHVIEVQPTGPSSGDIVWEWHVWDHLIQDFDPSKDNYGVVADHPELVDINYITSTQTDFMHTNSIDYNEEFDQILISVHNFNEIWVIDHSTTTEEAAGHTGGNSEKGGDLLYRWGNPHAYKAGSTSDRKLFSQHDASWIKEDYPGEGNILVFNNGANRPGSHYSSVDEIIPPVDENGEYYLEPGSAFGPESQTWIYTANPPTNFYASHISGATRLPDGNTLITNGETGLIFEVTPEKSTVWQYNTGGQLFKAVFVPPEEPPEPNIPDLDCSGSLTWNNVGPGATVEGSFIVENIGDEGSLLNWSLDMSSINWGTWTFNPESGVNLTPEEGEFIVEVSVVAPNEKKANFEGFIRVKNQNDKDDYGFIPVLLKTPKSVERNNIFINCLLNFLNKFPNMQKLIQKIIA